jgi:hypothetical protein
MSAVTGMTSWGVVELSMALHSIDNGVVLP